MSTPKVQMVAVRLHGGPLADTVVELPRSAERYRVGSFFTYEYAGKKEGQVCFAKRPTSRAMRRFARFYAVQFGQHPDVVRERQQPVRGTTSKRGQGARRRAAKRSA